MQSIIAVSAECVAFLAHHSALIFAVHYSCYVVLNITRKMLTAY